MPQFRVPLAVQADNRIASSGKDARLVNALIESGNGKKQIVKRPGTQTLTVTAEDANTIVSGQGQGIFTWNKYIVSCVANSLYTIKGEAKSNLKGTLNGSYLPLSYATVANDSTLVMHNGSNLYTMAKGVETAEPLFTGGVGVAGTVDSVYINNGGGFYGFPVACTVTSGATTTIAATGHGLTAGQGIQFYATTMPTGLVAGTTYQVVYVGANSFTVNTLSTAGEIGSAVVTSTTGTAVHYMASPTVIFGAPTGPGPVTALGTAQIFNNKVSGVIITVIGAGYTAAPSITFGAAAAGTNATVGTPTGYLATPTVIYTTGLPVTAGGSGYDITNPPVITFTSSRTLPPDNFYSATTDLSNASAYPVLTRGVVTSIIIGSGGNGTAYPLTATISAAPAPVLASGTTVMASSIQGPFAAGIAYLDNYCYIMDTKANVFASHYDNPTVWYSASLQASSDPDSGVALIRHLNYLVCFGQWSTEFFYDAATAVPASPLAVNQSAKLEIGCANGYSVAGAEQTIVWVGQSLTKGRSVYYMDGLSPVKISNRYIDKYLNLASMENTVDSGGNTISSVRSFCFKTSGHTLYVLTMIDINKTFIYDLDEKSWYEWTSQSGDTGVVDTGVETYFTPTSYDSNVEYGSHAYIQDNITGAISIISDTINQDGTNKIYLRSVSPIGDDGTTKYKFFRKVEAIGDKVAGTGYLRYSDDDYVTKSSFRSVTLSDTRPQIFQCGASRRRAWEFFFSDNLPLRIEALEIEFDVHEQT